MPTRRAFNATLAAGFTSLIFSRSMAESTSTIFDRFDSDLASVASDTNAVEATHAFRELDSRHRGPTADELAAQPSLARRFSSAKEISRRARDMIVIFEVSGELRYKQRYQRPIWPRGRSGITIGIGYDLGYVDADDFSDDWDSLIHSDAIMRLKAACRRTGSSAAALPPRYADIVIPWASAQSQFDDMLSMVSGETAHVFPGSSDLSADSFGALVSLVYNRGGSLKRNPADSQDRRREMRMIRQLLLTGAITEIPAQITQMKRLWEDEPDAAGLLKRRDMEASLFAAGLV